MKRFAVLLMISALVAGCASAFDDQSLAAGNTAADVQDVTMTGANGTVTVSGMSGTSLKVTYSPGVQYSACNLYVSGGNSTGLVLASQPMTYSGGSYTYTFSNPSFTSGAKIYLAILKNNAGVESIVPQGTLATTTSWSSFTYGANTATATPTPTPTPAWSLKVEAENYSVMSGVIKETCSEGGQNVGSIDANDWIVYPVTIPSAGVYTISYRVASIYAGKALKADYAAGANQLGTVNIPNTGNWQTWQTVSHTVTLPAGAINFGINGNTGGFNVNYFTITKSGTSTATPTPTPTPTATPTVAPTPTPTSGGSNPVPFNETYVTQLVNSGKIALMLADNSSEYNLADVYVAIIGKQNGTPVWLNPVSGAVSPINESYNTLTSPKAGDPWKYANIFSKATDIPNATIGMPKISAGKMFIAFKKPVYIHFFADGGFAPPSLDAGTADPSYGTRFEVLEFTWDNIALWINTSRVDAYQYAMGLEVWGTHASGTDTTYKNVEGMKYKRAGELLKHTDIINRWASSVSTPFQSCKVDRLGTVMIEQPSKIPAFKDGGAYKDFFKGYIDSIWNTFATRDLLFRTGEHDNTTVWVGRVSGNVFNFYNQSDPNRKCSIYGRPTTQDAIEGKGWLATSTATPGSQRMADDLQIQAQMCAAINRAVIDVNSTAIQNNHLDTSYFKRNPHNEYVSFFHNPAVSHNSRTYAFCYDDVGDWSSTIVFSGPRKVRLDIGGFAGLALP